MSTLGDVQYRGGYLVYRGGYLVYRGDAMSTVGDTQYRRGYHDACEDIMSTVGYSNNKRFSPTVLNTPHGTHDIPQRAS